MIVNDADAIRSATELERNESRITISEPSKVARHFAFQGEFIVKHFSCEQAAYRYLAREARERLRATCITDPNADADFCDADDAFNARDYRKVVDVYTHAMRDVPWAPKFFVGEVRVIE